MIVDVLLAIAPEFTDVDLARLDTFIDLAKCQVSEDVFGCDYELAVAYLAAHMLALSERNAEEGTNGQAGNVSSKKEGDLSVGYTMPFALNTVDGVLVTTSYGIEFLRLRGLHVIAANTFYGCG